MTSLRGLGKEILMPYPINQRAHQFNSIQSVPVSFGLWDTALKFLSPGPRSDVTDHLEGALVFYVKMVSVPSVSLKTMLKPALIILLAPSLETSFFKCCPWQVNFREIKTAEELKNNKHRHKERAGAT